MAFTSKVQICNLAQSMLGQADTVSDIDAPKTDREKTYAKWYDICRQFTLKLVKPNFALGREVVAQLPVGPAFGYEFQYAKPALCLAVLGVGNVEEKQNNYGVEGETIQHDTDYDEGMPVRFVKDITSVALFSPEYTLLLAQYIAAHAALEVTQDAQKAAKLMAALPTDMSTASGLNAQENRPVRISNSRFKAARRSDATNYESKK